MAETVSVDIGKLKNEAKAFLESKFIENGPFKYNYYLLADRGEIKEHDFSCKLASFDRKTPKFKPDEPDIVLMREINMKMIDIFEPLIDSRVKTRLIIGFDNCETSIGISE
jgi:hypothetical protein